MLPSLLPPLRSKCGRYLICYVSSSVVFYLAVDCSPTAQVCFYITDQWLFRLQILQSSFFFLFQRERFKSSFHGFQHFPARWRFLGIIAVFDLVVKHKSFRSGNSRGKFLAWKELNDIRSRKEIFALLRCCLENSAPQSDLSSFHALVLCMIPASPQDSE